jgi:hypothetical protein
MILAHNCTYNDEDVMTWYEEIARKVLENPVEVEEFEPDLKAMR